MRGFVVGAGIRLKKGKRILRNEHANVDKIKKVIKIAISIEYAIINIDIYICMNKLTAIQKTVELANLALEISKESLWINLLVPNKWEIVILDQEGKTTNMKYAKCLTNKEILLWINEWTTNKEIQKRWRQKRLHPQFICYT